MNSNDDFIRRMDRLLQDFQKILNDEKKQRRKTASRFSVFESFGVTRSESVHIHISEVSAGSHGAT